MPLVRSGALDRMGPYFSEQVDEYLSGIDCNRAVLLAAMDEAFKPLIRPHATEKADIWICWRYFAEQEVDIYAQYRNARELTLKEVKR